MDAPVTFINIEKAGKAGLVPKKVQVDKKGKAFMQTFWVKEGESGDDSGAIKTLRDRGLVVPPSAKNVWVNPDAKAGLQAKYKDSKNRVKRIYSAEFVAKNQAEKFARLRDFTKDYDRLVSRIEQDFDSNPAAKVLHLIAKTGFRIGSNVDTKAEKKAYGASTLDKQHATVNGNSITFNFTGKKGVAISQTVEDSRLAKHISERKQGQLFDADAVSVRSYLKSIDGNFKVKDFRTFTGTSTALLAIKKIGKTSSHKEYTKAVKYVCEQVAAKLGNTPAVSKSAYITPEVWDLLKGE